MEKLEIHIKPREKQIHSPLFFGSGSQLRGTKRFLGHLWYEVALGAAREVVGVDISILSLVTHPAGTNGVFNLPYMYGFHVGKKYHSHGVYESGSFLWKVVVESFFVGGKFDLWRGQSLAFLWPGCIFREKQTQQKSVELFLIHYRWFFPFTDRKIYVQVGVLWRDHSLSGRGWVWCMRSDQGGE